MQFLHLPHREITNRVVKYGRRRDETEVSPSVAILLIARWLRLGTWEDVSDDPNFIYATTMAALLIPHARTILLIGK
jgi:hypothetical protein